MKILVLGLYYSANLGDAVIGDCVRAQLEAAFPDAQVEIGDFLGRTSFDRGPEPSLETLQDQRRHGRLRRLASRFTPSDRVLRQEEKQLRRHLPAIREMCARPYDLVVIAGGQVFMDSLALYAAEYVRGFAARNVPVIFNACGTGPAVSRGIRSRLSDALALPQVKSISCRDDASLVTRRYLRGGRTAVPVSDPALACADVYRVQRDPAAQEIGLGIMFADSLPTERTTRFWIRLIAALEKRGLPWRFFINGSPRDLVYARTVYEKLPNRTEPFSTRLAPVPETPEELVSLIAGFRSIISFRLHSHIIAAALDVPSVAVLWDDKLNAFFQSLTYPERCLSARAGSEKVLDALAEAERTGYDRSRIDEIRHRSEAELLRAVREALQAAERSEPV